MKNKTKPMENYIHIGNSPQFKFARIGNVSEVVEVDDNFMQCSKNEKNFIVLQLMYLRETKGHSLEKLHEADMKAFNDLKADVTVKDIVQLLTKIGMATITVSHEGAKRVILFWRKAIELGFVEGKSR